MGYCLSPLVYPEDGAVTSHRTVRSPPWSIQVGSRTTSPAEDWRCVRRIPLCTWSLPCFQGRTSVRPVPHSSVRHIWTLDFGSRKIARRAVIVLSFSHGSLERGYEPWQPLNNLWRRSRNSGFAQPSWKRRPQLSRRRWPLSRTRWRHIKPKSPRRFPLEEEASRSSTSVRRAA